MTSCRGGATCHSVTLRAFNSAPPGVCQGWLSPRHLRKRVSGFFVLGIQPSRLGKRSMGRERKVCWGRMQAKKKPCCHFGRAGLSLGKAGLMCHAAHSCLCSRASGLGLLQSKPFKARGMTILPNWPHRAIPRRSESALKIDSDVRW